jgi:hypothetical protein
MIFCAQKRNSPSGWKRKLRPTPPRNNGAGYIIAYASGSRMTNLRELGIQLSCLK